MRVVKDTAEGNGGQGEPGLGDEAEAGDLFARESGAPGANRTNSQRTASMMSSMR